MADTIPVSLRVISGHTYIMSPDPPGRRKIQDETLWVPVPRNGFCVSKSVSFVFSFQWGFKVPASIQDASSLMRRSWIIVFLVATAIPLSASKHTTVAQLQQALNTAINAHKPDTEIAREIGGFELTERLTEATLGRLKARLVPGTQAARSLELLADRSAFFDPPANELPATPAPDSAEQTRILQAARRYVSQTLPRLPDFFATRVISLYDDRPQALKKDNWPTRSGLHLIDTSSGEISVRNERENQPATQGSAVWQANVGLISGGEFGNTLGMILADYGKWQHPLEPLGRVCEGWSRRLPL
jgi:hypothetical protein